MGFGNVVAAIGEEEMRGEKMICGCFFMIPLMIAMLDDTWFGRISTLMCMVGYMG
jgi:hypothetical protein